MFGSLAFAGEHCVDADTHVELIVDSMPMGEVVDTLTGDDLTIFLAAFNASPPVTKYTGDRVVIIASEITPSLIYAVLIDEGCVVFAGLIKAETVRKYKMGIPLTPIGWTI